MYTVKKKEGENDSQKILGAKNWTTCKNNNSKNLQKQNKTAEQGNVKLKWIFNHKSKTFI